MKYVTFEERETYQVAILIKESYLRKSELKRFYPTNLDGGVIFYALEYSNNKVPAKFGREYWNELKKELEDLGVQIVYIADSQYFKLITKEKKAEASIGYVFDVDKFKVTCGVNYGQLLHQAEAQERLELSLNTLKRLLRGEDNEITLSFKGSYYEGSYDYAELLGKESLACDIETLGLSLENNKIVSIAFSWNQEEGIAIYNPDYSQLRAFFNAYKGKLIFHNATFDIKMLIRHLYMNSLLDFEGMYRGLSKFNFEDTMVMAYMALNSTAKVSYTLKSLAHEFAGNYAIDVTDVSKIRTELLLQYNLIDTLCTWYVFNKYPVENEELHRFLLDTVRLLIVTELTGMPIDMNRVLEIEAILNQKREKLLNILTSFDAVKEAESVIQDRALNKINSKLKTKKYGKEKVQDTHFNHKSSTHLQILLYEVLDFSVTEVTDSGQPSTSRKVLEEFSNYKESTLLSSLVQLSEIDKILDSFIPAFKGAILKEDGNYYLHGNFRIGGTISGRLSSNSPNLTNIPSNSVYGKLIKSCFVSRDRLFVGADFSSLEDYVNTLVTKDTNKRKVYLHHYDSHCLRAYSYFGKQMPDIEQELKEIDVDEPIYEITTEEGKTYFSESTCKRKGYL